MLRRALKEVRLHRRLADGGEQPLERPYPVTGTVRYLEAGFSDTHGFARISIHQMVGGHSQVRRYDGRNVQSLICAVARGAALVTAGKLPRQIEVALCFFLLTAPEEDETRPNIEARKQSSLIEAAGKSDRTLRYLHRTVPVASSRMVLNPELRRPQRQKRGLHLLRQPLALLEVFHDLGRIACHAAEEREPPVRGPLQHVLVRRARVGESLVSGRASEVERAGPRV